MLIKSISRAALASALILAFSACSDDSSSGPDFDDEATTAETEDMADGGAEAATQIATSLNFGGPSIFIGAPAALTKFTAKHPMSSRPLGGVAFTGQLGSIAPRGDGLQMVAAVGCSVEGHGSIGENPFVPFDGNENGIPDDWRIKVVCVEKDSSDAENIVTFTESQEYWAKENTAALHGFDAAVTLTIRAADEEGNAEGIEFKGSDELDLRAASAEHHYSFAVRQYATSEGETMEQSGGESWDASFDPDGTIALGSDLPDGELDFTGRNWYANSEDVSLSFTLDTPTALAYSAACADIDDNPPFTAGVIRGRLNGNASSASFTVTMNDCGNFTVDVDNTSDEVVVVSAKH